MIAPMTSAAPGGSRRLHFEHDAMACTFGLTLLNLERSYAESAAQVVWDEVDRLERALSRFILHSDIGRINALAMGESVRVGADAWECLMLAAAICLASGGAFDVTFGSDRPPPGASGPDRPGFFGALAFDPANRAVAVLRTGVRVDLGAIGKGYALDQAAERLRDWGVADALLNAGQSTALALGTAGGEPWRVALRDPLDAAATRGEVELAGLALSGSGRELHGEHIRHGRSGDTPQETIAAWALAPNAALSDALSTAAMLLPPDAAAALCASLPDSGVRLFRGGTAGPEELAFGAWPNS